jgi:hypothetical protein
VFPQRVHNVLLADNPWIEGDDPTSWVRGHLPERFIQRQSRIVLQDRAVMVIGPRQSGKSTLIWKTLSDLDEPCLLVDCEEPAIREWSRSPALFLRGLRDMVPPGTVIFFEEIQNLDEAGLFLKGLVDRRSGYRIIATGSSSFQLESRTRESLAGRATRHLLLPFSLSELVDAKTTGSVAMRAKRTREILEHLMIHGGYPDVHLGRRREAVLTGLVESFVIRDASDRFRIRHTDAFRKLLELMASQIGSLCNYSHWAANTGVSVDTMREYSTILTDAHVVRLVRPFVGGRRAEITSTPKVYFLDNGIRNRLFGGFTPSENRPDRGALLENFVFTELAKTLNPIVDGIRFWRSKSGAEVDFVIERAGELGAIEVKAGNTGGRLTRSAHSFIDAYSPAWFCVVSDRPHEGFDRHETRVLFRTPDELPGMLGSF